jgi:hypothetical protein
LLRDRSSWRAVWFICIGADFSSVMTHNTGSIENRSAESELQCAVAVNDFFILTRSPIRVTKISCESG